MCPGQHLPPPPPKPENSTSSIAESSMDWKILLSALVFNSVSAFVALVVQFHVEAKLMKNYLMELH